MTGPGPGKIPVKDAKVVLFSAEGPRVLEANVYIHLKGYSRARVTHLDIEHPGLNEFFPPRTSFYARVRGTVDGFVADFSRYLKGVYVEMSSRTLRRVVRPGEFTIVYVGGKEGGIFLGFRKQYVQRLEELAAELGEPSPRRDAPGV